MTTAPEKSAETTVEKSDLVTCTIDGVEVSVPKGTLVIRAAEQIGIQIPRFCDHPLLDPVGACRQCLVDVVDAGNGRGFPKPQASCTLPVEPGMVVHTQATSPVADKAQQGVMEFLLINHPLDCPVCDKGGECPLQNQAMSNGRGDSRFTESKRLFPKPIPLSAQILLDRERCIVCQRCTRFAAEVAGDPGIALIERGARQQIGIADDKPFDSYFSGNTVQICPVGALTSAAYRFRARPFDLVSTPSVTEHDASGAAIRVDHRRGKVVRRLAGDDAEVNEEWITDKDRFAFRYAQLKDRLQHPLVRDEDSGELRVASWPEAFAVAARGLAAAGSVGLLPGGRLTAEDAYAWSKFARHTLGTNDIDFRARAHSAEEASFLAAHVALTSGVTYDDLESATSVLLVALEPEDECGSIFLRLRKAYRKNRTTVLAIAPYASLGLQKVGGQLIPAAPGTEPAAVRQVAAEVPLGDGGIVLVGERAAEVPGLLAAVVSLAEATGARLAWVPRRAGDRGAVEAGCLPGLLPGGRPVADAGARVDVAAAWGSPSLPEAPGRSADEILAAAADGSLGALVIGGVDPRDVPASLGAALEKAFVVSLELRPNAITAAADVVLPVAAAVEKAGSFVNWEGRVRPFPKVLDVPHALPDTRVLAGISEEFDRPLGFRTTAQAAAEMQQLGGWDGDRPAFTHDNVAPGAAGDTGGPDSDIRMSGSALLLASHKQLVDDGLLQDGEDALRQTGRPNVARISQATADAAGLQDGQPAVLTGPRGSLTLTVAIGDVADGVVWAPATVPGAAVRELVGKSGDAVTLEGAQG